MPTTGFPKEEGKSSLIEHDKGWYYFLNQLAKHCEKQNKTSISRFES
jgi:hypothetical protein